MILLFIAGCGQSNPADNLFESNVQFVEVPVDSGELSISINNPIADGKKVSYQVQLTGVCGAAGKVVEITGAATAYSVCLADKTWSATIDLSNAAVGTLTLDAYLVSEVSGTKRKSSPATRVLNKISSDCDTKAKRDSTFANIATGGNGNTVPYTLCTAAQLANIRSNAAYLAHKYEVLNDLDFSGTLHLTIAGTFTGQIEGNGFSVKGLNIVQGTTAEIGLFQYLNGATIRNLTFSNTSIVGAGQTGTLAGRIRGTATTTLENLKFDGTVTGTTNVGGIAGYIDGTPTVVMNQITSSLAVSGSSSSVGGLLGQNSSAGSSVTVSNSTLSGTIQGTTQVGGVVGYAVGALTMNSVTKTGNVILTTSYGAGLVGRAGAALNITSGTFTGNVTSSINGGAAYVGGLAGQANSTTTVSTCSVTGDINAGGTHVGGIIGDVHSGSISTCRYLGQITAVDTAAGTLLERIGGIVGNHSNAAGLAISNSVVAGGIDGNAFTIGSITTGGRYVGGIAGVLTTGATVSQSKAFMHVSGRQQRLSVGIGSFNGSTVDQITTSGNITIEEAATATNLGGVIGGSYNNAVEVTNVQFTGNIIVNSITTTPSNIGGVIGYFVGSKLENATSNAILNFPSYNHIGGLVGHSFAPNSSFINLTHNRNVTGNANVGGIVGGTTDSGQTFSNCVYAGVVTGSGANVGGLVGNVGNNATFNSNSRTSGTVSGTSTIGGLVGTAGNNLTLTSVSSTANISGTSSIGGLVGTTGTGLNASTITSSGQVSGTSTSVGGLFGYIGANSSLTSSSATGAVSGAGYVGGIVGQSRGNVDLTDVYATGNITSTGDYAGGVDGGSDQTGRDLTRVYATGHVTGTQFVGGLSGRVHGNVTQSFALGNVTSSGIRSGGITGYQGAGYIEATFATGVIKGTERVGGLVGDAQSTAATIRHSYFTGTVIRATGGAANDRFGPIVGIRAANDRVQTASSFWRGDGSSIVLNEADLTAYAGANTLGTVKTSANLAIQAQLSPLDFGGTVWKMPAATYKLPGQNPVYTFPIFVWMN